MAKAASVDGWLRCVKSTPHHRYRCDLCNKDVDSMKNLQQHRSSKPCMALAASNLHINSPPLDPETYIIRRRAEPEAPTGQDEVST